MVKGNSQPLCHQLRRKCMIIAAQPRVIFHKTSLSHLRKKQRYFRKDGSVIDGTKDTSILRKRVYTCQSHTVLQTDYDFKLLAINLLLSSEKGGERDSTPLSPTTPRMDDNVAVSPSVNFHKKSSSNLCEKQKYFR